MRRTVILVAGGKGLRMGGELPKQFIPLHGRPVLMHTMEVFFRWDAKAEQILVLPEEHQAYWQMLCRELNCTIPHRVVHGGETRFHLAFYAQYRNKICCTPRNQQSQKTPNRKKL